MFGQHNADMSPAPLCVICVTRISRSYHAEVRRTGVAAKVEAAAHLARQLPSMAGMAGIDGMIRTSVTPGAGL